MSFEPIHPSTASQHGLSINQNNGIYQHGKSYGIDKKLSVVQCYNSKIIQGEQPTASSIAAECCLGWKFTNNVILELKENGFVTDPHQQPKKSTQEIGLHTLDTIDEFVLYLLYLELPSRSNKSYCKELHFYTGTIVSESTISRFFNHGFPIKGNLRKPDMIPYDKFKPHNIQRAMDYVDMISRINPARIKFADEKLLKGEDVYNRKNRRNVLTGEVPPVFTQSDFRNTYSITGICGIDMTSPLAVWYNIHDDINDATSFSICVEGAIKAGFLKAGDVLVIDNAAIHTKGDNEGFEEWLWNSFGILVLLLPTRSPELNPIELVWRTLVQRLKQYPLHLLKSYGAHSTAKATMHVLNNMDHHDVAATYNLVGLV